jgi:hypothetical protein
METREKQVAWVNQSGIKTHFRGFLSSSLVFHITAGIGKALCQYRTIGVQLRNKNDATFSATTT